MRIKKRVARARDVQAFGAGMISVQSGFICLQAGSS